MLGYCCKGGWQEFPDHDRLPHPSSCLENEVESYRVGMHVPQYLNTSYWRQSDNMKQVHHQSYIVLLYMLLQVYISLQN